MLSVLARDRLDLRARELGHRLRAGLTELADRHGMVGDVRGRGLLMGLELADPDADRLGGVVTRRCTELGLHMNIVQLPGLGGTFRIAPPLTATDEEIDRGVAILGTALGEVAPQAARGGRTGDEPGAVSLPRAGAAGGGARSG